MLQPWIFNLEIFPTDTPTPFQRINSHLLTIFIHFFFFFTHQIMFTLMLSFWEVTKQNKLTNQLECK